MSEMRKLFIKLYNTLETKQGSPLKKIPFSFYFTVVSRTGSSNGQCGQQRCAPVIVRTVKVRGISG